MGDYFSPRRRDVVDRLRRRIELYRSRQNWSRSRYEPGINGVYDQQKQDTLLLHQKWLECKAKKTAKHSKAPKEFGSQADQRSQPLTKKRKLDSSSIGGGVGNTGPGDNNLDSAFYEDRDSPKVKIPCSSNISSQKQDDSVLPSVSVQIVQQISAQQDQTIQTNVTVSSTVKGSANTHPSSTGQAGAAPQQTSTNIHTSTNIECKQEPQDNPCSCPSNLNPFGIDDVDELQAILETLEREEGEIPPDLIKELDKLGEPCDSVNSVGSDHDPDTDFKDQLFGTGSGKGSPGMFGDPSTPLPYDAGPPGRDAAASNQNMGGMNQNNQTFNQAPPPGAAPPPPVGGAQPSSGILNMAEPTGPAAETLKQMAAQHQIPDNGHFSMKQTMSYSTESSVTESYAPSPRGQSGMQTQGSTSYPHVYTNQQTMPTHHANSQQDSGMFSYNQQQQQQPSQTQQQVRVAAPNHHQPVPRMTRPGMERPPVPPHMPMPTMHIKQDPSLGYGGTKPLSHFTHPQMHPDGMSSQQTTPSSLQQLQEQVHSHFPQGPNQGPTPTVSPQAQQQSRVQLTQNQQIQMSQSRGQHIQMSQRQQMQMHSGPGGMQTAHQISMSQQQSFSMSQQQHAQVLAGRGRHQNLPAQSATYMNDQMKMQLMQQKMRQQRMREHQMMEQRQAQMQGYMNRPPPEYKMGAGHMQPQGAADPAGYPRNTGVAGGSGSTNPLQTMQNMVNQTSQGPPQIGSSQNAMYTMVKQEVGQPPIPPQHTMASSGMDIAGGRHMSQQMVSSSHSVAGRIPAGLPPSQQQAPPQVDMGQNFPPHQRQPPVYQPQTLNNGTMHSQVKSTGAPAYTSAIMRGQRPPNVNVGPEGLNISQQRTHSSDWPRPSMMQQQQNSANQQMGRVPVPRGMQPNTMMQQFTGYSSAGQTPAGMAMGTGMAMQGHPHQRANPAHMMTSQQQQERAMMQQQQSMVQDRTMMQQHQQQQGHVQERTMMQQQQQQQQQMQEMHMRHQNAAHGQMANVNMSQSVSMTTRTAQEFPANSAAGTTDFPLDFLDGPQAGSTDFFDSNSAEFNLIDEIFGK